MKHMGGRDYQLWDEQDGFFYDVLRYPDGGFHKFRVRSLVGLIPLSPSSGWRSDWIEPFPEFTREPATGSCATAATWSQDVVHRVERDGQATHVLTIVDERAAAAAARAHARTRTSSSRPTASAACRSTTRRTRSGSATARSRYEPAEAIVEDQGRQLELARPDLVPDRVPADRVAAQAGQGVRPDVHGAPPAAARAAADAPARWPSEHGRPADPHLHARRGRPAAGLRRQREVPGRPALARPASCSTSTSTATTAPAWGPVAPDRLDRPGGVADRRVERPGAGPVATRRSTTPQSHSSSTLGPLGSGRQSTVLFAMRRKSVTKHLGQLPLSVVSLDSTPQSLVQAQDPTMPTSPGDRLAVAGLFAGIGGIELGLHEAGHASVLLCEIDAGASAVLSQQFPEAELVRDVRTIEALPPVDLIAAGFPCQDLSQAGRTAGINGKNSGLVGQVFRLLDSRRRAPRWLMLENVSFMLQLEAGKAMRYLVDELEARGFAWAYRVVDTRGFGLPQRRQRVILLASRREDPRQILFADNSEPADPLFTKDTLCGFYWTEGLRGLGWAVDHVPTLKGGSSIGIPSPPGIWDPRTGHIVTPDIRDAERLQGFEPDWTLPAVEAAGVRRGHRWKLVGNAVSVPVARWIGKRLASPGTYDASRTGAVLRRGAAWPRAAWGHDGKAHTVGASLWPVSVPAPHLSDFLRFPLAPLSARAASGFLSRALVSRLWFEDGFREDVRRHVEKMAALAVA